MQHTAPTSTPTLSCSLHTCVSPRLFCMYVCKAESSEICNKAESTQESRVPLDGDRILRERQHHIPSWCWGDPKTQKNPQKRFSLTVAVLNRLRIFLGFPVLRSSGPGSGVLCCLTLFFSRQVLGIFLRFFVVFEVRTHKSTGVGRRCCGFLKIRI